MKSQELRIGNLTEQGEIKNFWEKGVHVGFGKCYEFNELNPIPLTEEWLLKFGFEKYGTMHNSYKLNPFIIEECFLGNGYTFRKIINKYESYLLKEINYLHELQNIYFILKGYELK